MNLTIDLNTILTALACAGISYVIATITRLDKAQAVASTELATLRARVVVAEARLESLRITVTRLCAASGIEEAEPEMPASG